jgi:Family of unknown function (DUF5335)
MAHVQPLPRSAWPDWFNRMSEALIGKRAEIEVASLELGDQIVADWIPLLGISYDAKNDLVAVALDGVHHLLRHPREIVVDQDATGVSGIAILDVDGNRQIVRLRDPLMLPPSVTT